MNLDRRSLLMGAAFAGLAAAGTGPAKACTRQIYHPLQGRFWTRLWRFSVTLPREEVRLAQALVHAIAHGAADQLDGLFAREADLVRRPRLGDSGTAAMPYERADAIVYLANLVGRQGPRTIRIDYFASLIPHLRFLIHARLGGYGPPAPRPPDPSITAVPAFHSICGEDPRDWERQLVLVYDVELARLEERPRIRTLHWVA